MTEYLNTIIKTRLFDNIDKKEIPNILNNFKSQKKLYEKGNIIIDMADMQSAYVYLAGMASVILPILLVILLSPSTSRNL